MDLEFLPQGPALVIEESMRVLVIADLHFGIESDFARKGVHIPSQTAERVRRARECIRTANADLLVLLGDIKHNVPLTSRQEFRELPAILDAFRTEIPLRVTPGNHDGGLERFLAPEEMLPIRGALIDEVWYFHGHTYPDPACSGGFLIAGHHHPMVSLYDEVGCALYDRAYVLAELEERCLHLAEKGGTRILLVPAFNELSGLDILQWRELGLGPIPRCMNINEAEVVLTDGTYVGTVGSLERDRP